MRKSFEQCSNPATFSKWSRMCHALGWSSSVRFLQVGFSDWWLSRDEFGNFIIIVQSSYHSESTLDDMYKTNFKGWRKDSVKLL